MIKIGNDKLFSMMEILENLREYLQYETKEDIRGGACDFQISAVAVVIGESADFVRGFVANK